MVWMVEGGGGGGAGLPMCDVRVCVSQLLRVLAEAAASPSAGSAAPCCACKGHGDKHNARRLWKSSRMSLCMVVLARL